MQTLKRYQFFNKMRPIACQVVQATSPFQRPTQTPQLSTQRSHDPTPSGPTTQYSAVPRFSTKRSHESAPSGPRFSTKRSHNSTKSGPTIQHQAVPRLSTPGKETSTHCTGGWVGPRAGLDGCGKSRPTTPQGYDARTVQPVASRYTD